MRIIIEAVDQSVQVTPSEEPITPAIAEVIDGGAPSETPINAVGEALSTSTEREGMNGGSPPEWLVEAIQGAAQPSIENSSMDTDAGSAPSSEQ